MGQQIVVPFLIFSLLAPPTAAATPTHQDTPEATVSTQTNGADSLVVPDGTPLRIKAVNGFSSARAKVGDLIDFTVAFAVRADGIIVIPQRAALAARVVSVSRPRRAARGGQVKVIYEGLRLTTGEAASVRAALKPPHDNKAQRHSGGSRGDGRGGFWIVPYVGCPAGRSSYKRG